MTFTTELFNEPANVSVYPLSRIRLQTYCTNQLEIIDCQLFMLLDKKNK